MPLHDPPPIPSRRVLRYHAMLRMPHVARDTVARKMVRDGVDPQLLKLSPDDISPNSPAGSTLGAPRGNRVKGSYPRINGIAHTLTIHISTGLQHRCMTQSFFFFFDAFSIPGTSDEPWAPPPPLSLRRHDIASSSLPGAFGGGRSGMSGKDRRAAAAAGSAWGGGGVGTGSAAEAAGEGVTTSALDRGAVDAKTVKHSRDRAVRCPFQFNSSERGRKLGVLGKGFISKSSGAGIFFHWHVLLASAWSSVGVFVLVRRPRGRAPKRPLSAGGDKPVAHGGRQQRGRRIRRPRRRGGRARAPRRGPRLGPCLGPAAPRVARRAAARGWCCCCCCCWWWWWWWWWWWCRHGHGTAAALRGWSERHGKFRGRWRGKE